MMSLDIKFAPTSLNMSKIKRGMKMNIKIIKKKRKKEKEYKKKPGHV